MLPWALAHCAITWSLVGVIWMVQLVHYPLMRHVTHAYHAEHMDAMGFFVAPLMLLELALVLAPCLPDMGGTGRAVLDAAPGLSANSVHELAALPRGRVWGGAALLVHHR